MTVTPEDVIGFWRDAGPEGWFKKDPAFDEAIRVRFGEAVNAAIAGELDDWRKTSDGAYALVLLLDQFPRNIFRGDARAFSGDSKAVALADLAIAKGFDQDLSVAERAFFYLPFEHAEDIALQDRAVALFAAAGDPELLRWAEVHRDIIARFGRFPHRNAALGRESSDEEQAFLDEGGFAG